MQEKLEKVYKQLFDLFVFFATATQGLTEVSAHLLLWAPALCVEMGFMRTFVWKKNGTEELMLEGVD